MAPKSPMAHYRLGVVYVEPVVTCAWQIAEYVRRINALPEKHSSGLDRTAACYRSGDDFGQDRNSHPVKFEIEIEGAACLSVAGNNKVGVANGDVGENELPLDGAAEDGVALNRVVVPIECKWGITTNIDRCYFSAEVITICELDDQEPVGG